MIKRYSITLSKNLLSKQFTASINGDYTPFYNAGPGQKLPVITSDNPHRIQLFQWGILPYNSNELGASDKLINARAKTLFAKEPYCNLIESKRCIIPADSFYVWKEQFNVSTPYRVIPVLENTFSIAGIWDSWQVNDEENMFGSFTMITQVAQNDLIEYTDRSPLILNNEEREIWLDDRADVSKIVKITTEHQNNVKFNIIKMSNLVNNLSNNTRKVIKEINAPLPGETLSLF